MRISIRVSAAGDRSLTRIPFAARELKDCLNCHGKIDRALAQTALFGSVSHADGSYNPFTPSSSDDEMVYFAALTFLDNLHEAYATVVADERADCHAETQCRQDERLVTRMDEGRFVFVRISINRVRAGVSVSVAVNNPHGVVGKSEVEARMFAVTAVQLYLRIATQCPWISVTAAPDIVADARAANARAEYRRDYADCPRRCGEGGCYCSPIDPACPLYRAGRCGYAEAVRGE